MKGSKKCLIEFIDVEGATPFEYAPVPAKNLLPEWYKKLNPYINGSRKIGNPEKTASTVKRCVPFLDSLMSGYLILLTDDIDVSNTDDGHKYYKWPQSERVGFHGPDQFRGYPLGDHPNDMPVAKFKNPWGIRTPKGYSTLFINPVHRESNFSILEGVVDTDTYNFAVGLPFVLHDYSWEGIIPAGTPIAQVIPFKRDEWEHSVYRDKDVKEGPAFRTAILRRSHFFDGYRKKFWSKKSFN